MGFALANLNRDAQALSAWTEGVTKFPYASKIWEDLAIYYFATATTPRRARRRRSRC